MLHITVRAEERETYPDWVGGMSTHNVHICEIPGFGVVLEISSPDNCNLAAQIQLLTQISAALQRRQLWLSAILYGFWMCSV